MEISQKHKIGGELINSGGCLALGPSGIFRKEATSGGSNPARLGELGSNHLPHFSIKWHEWGLRKGFNILGIQFSLKISEEKKKEGKNPSRGTFVTLP